MNREQLEHVLRAYAHWVRGLLRHGLIELPRLLDRLAALASAGVRIEPLLDWARRRATEVAGCP